MQPLRLGTRGSALALWQANHIADLLRFLIAPRPVELVLLQTMGDQVQHVQLSQLGGQGVFTREIQRAVLDGTADVAVHSLKDLPTVPTLALTLAAVPLRGPAEDAFLSLRHSAFDDLPQGATVATGSPRRRAQLLHSRPDLRLIELRGNVDTRLRKLQEQGWDGMILACAGLKRLGLEAHIKEVLNPQWMIPAVGQGALGLECRAGDAETRQVLSLLNHEPSFQAVTAERSFMRGLGGGCLQPIAALARVNSATLELHGAVLSADGTQRVSGTNSGPAAQAEEVGLGLAKRLLSQGADRLLA
jgi:hydroxymethylbilane synthase